MILRHCKRNPIHARWQVVATRVFVAWLFAGTLWGSGQSVYSQILPSPSSTAKSAVGLIVAQGRLQPTKGVLKLSVPLGDRIEKILVEPGAQVGLGDSLALLN
jgi:multidrug efflux pump subunit AcrA (membrane-fusion protein)